MHIHAVSPHEAGECMSERQICVGKKRGVRAQTVEGVSPRSVKLIHLQQENKITSGILCLTPVFVDFGYIIRLPRSSLRFSASYYVEERLGRQKQHISV